MYGDMQEMMDKQNQAGMQQQVELVQRQEVVHETQSPETRVNGPANIDGGKAGILSGASVTTKFNNELILA